MAVLYSLLIIDVVLSLVYGIPPILSTIIDVHHVSAGRRDGNHIVGFNTSYVAAAGV